jgi:hypothetical protein
MTPDRAAERSVIGALLLEPDRLADVREWLEPGDFHGTAERQAYEAICAVDARGQVPSPAAVDHELRERRTSAPLLADGAYLVGCMQLCPHRRGQRCTAGWCWRCRSVGGSSSRGLGYANAQRRQ